MMVIFLRYHVKRRSTQGLRRMIQGMLRQAQHERHRACFGLRPT